MLGLPMRTLGSDLSWGTRPKFGGGRGVCIRLAHEDLGSDLSWSPGPSSNGDGVLGLLLVTVLGLVETQAQLHCWVASCSPC